MKLGIFTANPPLGVYLPSSFAGAEELTEMVRAAERFGFCCAWVLDSMPPSYEHYTRPGTPPQCYEAMLSVCYLAAVSKTIRFGTTTSQLPLHGPVLLARQSCRIGCVKRSPLPAWRRALSSPLAVWLEYASGSHAKARAKNPNRLRRFQATFDELELHWHRRISPEQLDIGQLSGVDLCVLMYFVVLDSNELLHLYFTHHSAGRSRQPNGGRPQDQGG